MAVNQIYSAWDTLQSFNQVSVTTTPQRISGGPAGANLAALGNKPANSNRALLVIYNPVGGDQVQLSTDAGGLNIFMIIPAGNQPVTVPAKSTFPIFIATATTTATTGVMEVS